MGARIEGLDRGREKEGQGMENGKEKGRKVGVRRRVKG